MSARWTQRRRPAPTDRVQHRAQQQLRRRILPVPPSARAAPSPVLREARGPPTPPRRRADSSSSEDEP
ncbi:KH domain-containing, RNA-binding, signal transduction-associated protein 2, partial [Frankliniella fusca]